MYAWLIGSELEISAPTFGQELQFADPGSQNEQRSVGIRRIPCQPKDGILKNITFFAVYEEGGRADGYVVYSTSKTPDQDNNILLKELVGATDAAHAALWRFILSIDIVDEITDLYMPQDDPLWWMLLNPRALNLKAYDAIWLRILDVEKTLSARKYSANCELVFRVEDEYCRWIAGNYRMVAGDDGTAIVERTDLTPDITLTADALATCYFGNAKFSELREAGRVQEITAGAIAKADIAFYVERQPWCPLMY